MHKQGTHFVLWLWIITVYVIGSYGLPGCKKASDDGNQLGNSSDAVDSSNASRRFGKAVFFGDTDTVKALIPEVEDVNAVPPDYVMSPLSIASAWGYTSIARLLIEHGADPSKADPEVAGMTPLHHAARRGQLEIAELLLKHGADVDARDTSNGITPLMVAARAYPEVVRILLEHGASPDITTTEGKTAMDYAIERQCDACINTLIMWQEHNGSDAQDRPTP